MRLWHKDLIPVLPRQQLLGQWRECCAIAKNIHDNGTPNHILVNPIMDYPIEMFNVYSFRIYEEMRKRGFRVDWDSFTKHCKTCKFDMWAPDDVFNGWHNDRYLTQCLANLEEKHDRGGVSDEEWNNILQYVARRKMK